MKIGILGGTFDPVHNGHLALAQRARDALHLDTVIFIPALFPPHKDPAAITDIRHRCAMLELALADCRCGEISDIEIQAGKTMYTVDTLRELKTRYPEKTQFFLLVGSDFIAEYTTWKEPDELKKLATIIIAARPGFSFRSVPENMQLLEGNFPLVAARDIRILMSRQQNVLGLMPEAVWRYCKQHHLYQ